MRKLISQDSCNHSGESVAESNPDSQPSPCYDKPMSESNDHDLISFVATTVETMRDQMATKDDLVKMATSIEILRDQMATKDDLARLKEQMATKDDLAGLKVEIKDDISRLATTVRGDFEQVNFRFDTLERAISTRLGQVETDISRLRSVLYLLVKDKPDMLRLLGQPTPSENRPKGESVLPTVSIIQSLAISPQFHPDIFVPSQQPSDQHQTCSRQLAEPPVQFGAACLYLSPIR